MPDVIDLLNLMKSDPQVVKTMDSKKIADYGLTSAELEKIKMLDPELVRRVVDAIDLKLRTNPVAGTNACPGTFACVDSRNLPKEFTKTQPIGR